MDRCHQWHHFASGNIFGFWHLGFWGKTITDDGVQAALQGPFLARNKLCLVWRRSNPWHWTATSVYNPNTLHVIIIPGGSFWLFGPWGLIYIFREVAQAGRNRLGWKGGQHVRSLFHQINMSQHFKYVVPFSHYHFWLSTYFLSPYENATAVIHPGRCALKSECVSWNCKLFHGRRSEMVPVF